MLSRSMGSALKGKGKARFVVNTSTMPLAAAGRSTPSIASAGPSRSSAVAAYSTVLESRIQCTCRSSPKIGNARSVPTFIVQKARLHASASQSQQQEQASIPEIADLSMREYHEIADRTMDTLTDTLEVIQEDLADDEFDIEYSSGVLTVKLPADKGTYVINKQPPNKQIWLSSPLSGPKRYDYSTKDAHWFYTRDGSFLINLLEEELSEKLGRKVSFDALHES